MKQSTRKVSKSKLIFDRFSTAVTRQTGRPVAFLSALLIVIVWAVTGPFFGYSETWQLVINTGTTIITFLMVFIIQQSQNKDTVALHLKLNELIAANRAASNRLIDIEDLTEDELTALKSFYVKLSQLAEEEGEIFTTHSIDEARANHVTKKKPGKSTASTDSGTQGLQASDKHLDERNDELHIRD